MVDSRGERNSNNKQHLNQMQMDAMVAQVMSAMHQQFENIRADLKRLATEKPRSSHDHSASKQCYRHSSRVHSSRERRHDRDEKQSRPPDSLAYLPTEIPSFHGTNNPKEYLEWEKKMELLLNCREHTTELILKLAPTEFKDEAWRWWDKLITTRRRTGDEPIKSWDQLKKIMRRRFVPGYDYYHRVEQRSVERAKHLQKQIREQKLYEEVKRHVQEAFNSVEARQKKNLATHHSNGTETTKEKPSCAKESSQIVKHLPLLMKSLEAKCDLPLFQSDSVQLTHLEPVQPSCFVSVSQVLEETSQEDSPAGTQRSFSIEQPTRLVPQPALMPFPCDYPRKHCKEVDLVRNASSLFVMISAQDENILV